MRLLLLPLLGWWGGEAKRSGWIWGGAFATSFARQLAEIYDRMALVAYSDSEGSDNEEIAAPVSIPSQPASKLQDKQAFQKLTKASEPRKIKVDLPSVKPDPSQQGESQPPAKRVRTAGAFSGFNSLLPAPKQPAKSTPKAGVSLKTSSEAVFSRAPPLQQTGDWNGDEDVNGDGDGINGGADRPTIATEEPQLVGKATKFKPLSVSNRKKPVKKVKPFEEPSNGVKDQESRPRTEESAVAPDPVATAPLPKPKRSLFSVPQAEQSPATDTAAEDEGFTTQNFKKSDPEIPQQPAMQPPPMSANPDSLQSVASDLNLTPAQQRQLFGRKGRGQDISVAHFNLESEYAANEQLRQAGEVVEHRAVKAIAPGKHSLQQLVNNARTQQEGLEDKWAAGRQARGEGGSKYGWGK